MCEHGGECVKGSGFTLLRGCRTIGSGSEVTAPGRTESIISIATASTGQKQLELTVTSEQEATFRRAAEILGVSLDEFAVSLLQAEAEATIREYEEATITLSPRDSLVFAQAVLDPPEPNEALRRAVRDYRKWVAGI